MFVDSDDMAKSIFNKLSNSNVIYLDTETNGLLPFKGNRLCGISMADEENEYYFPFRHAEGFNLNIKDYLEVLDNLLQPRTSIGWNYKFDLHMLYVDGIETPKSVKDIQLAAHLMNENEESYFRLKEVANKYLHSKANIEEQKLKAILLKNGYGKADMWRLEGKIVSPYACDDVKLTRELYKFYIPHLTTWGVYNLWEEVNQYMYITTKMEQRGILIDPFKCVDFAEEAQELADKTLNKLELAAGYKINPNSSKQVTAWLGTPDSKKETLELLENDNPNVRLIMDYRGYSKANSSYYEPYIQLMDEYNVIHANLNLSGTISGRLSCNTPNLQAVPTKKTEMKVKEVFFAREGYTFISGDYSQAEMRLACHYAQEVKMSKLLKEGFDIHTKTSEKLGIIRDHAKRINFGVIYGIGARGLSRNLNIPESKAKEYLKLYHNEYPGFKRLYQHCEKTAKERGFIRMWTGRTRKYNMGHIITPVHKAMSNLIQGGVAEIMRVTILKLFPLMEQYNAYMILQIHDQIMFEVPNKVVEEILPKIKTIMEDLPFDVPMKVDFSIGDSWGSLKKVQISQEGVV